MIYKSIRAFVLLIIIKWTDIKGKMTQNHLFSLDINCGNLPYFNSIIVDKNQFQDSIAFFTSNFESLKLFSTENIVFGLFFINPLNEVCETCVFKKEAQRLYSTEKSQGVRKSLDKFI